MSQRVVGTAGLRQECAVGICWVRVAQITEDLSCISSRGAGPQVGGKRRRQLGPAQGLKGSVRNGSSLRRSELSVELGEDWRSLRAPRSHTECRATGEQEGAGCFSSVVRPREPKRCGLASVEEGLRWGQDCRAQVQLQLRGVGRDLRGLQGPKLRGRPGLKCVQGRAPAWAEVKMEETKTLEAEV